MPLDMTPEQKEIGKANFHRVVGQLAEQAEQARKKGVTRRDFMKGMLAGAGALPVSAAAYFGYRYEKLDGKPVKTALIGAGDEGGVLVTEHNPKYLEIVAVCDIRPTNQERIFKGDPPWSARKGLNFHYGKDATNKIKVVDDYQEILKDKDIEAVIIALPLFLHQQVAIDAMKAGKHVLCEKLMAWNISQCKDMIRVADEQDRVLSIGHQRHYSLLYAHAVEVLGSGVLGDVKHIRAQWHRNNTLPRPDNANDYRDSWHPPINEKDRIALQDKVRQYGYKNMEELIRWRLFERTGGGLMAELGSHQLDACSIFLGKVHPLAVSGVGTKSFYRDQYRKHEREVDDHVFVTFEFPGKNYYADEQRKAVKDKDDVVVVTYSSINTNSFEPYGECVMGTRGTMVVEQEQIVMIYPERGGGRSLAVGVTGAGGGQPALDSSASTGPAASAASSVGAAALGSGPVSRGYKEEMEHFAYCIRMHGEVQDDSEEAKKERQKWRETVRCHGKVAMADAIIALTSNLAMKHHQRIEFKEDWFKAESPDVPDAEMKAQEITS